MTTSRTPADYSQDPLISAFGKPQVASQFSYENDPLISAFPTQSIAPVDFSVPTPANLAESERQAQIRGQEYQKRQPGFFEQLLASPEVAISMLQNTPLSLIGALATGGKSEDMAKFMQKYGYEMKTRGGQAVAEKLGKVTEALPPVLGMGGTVTGALESSLPVGKTLIRQSISDLRDKFPKIRVEQAPSGLQSAGAAAALPESVVRGNIEAALTNASPELQAHVASKNPRAVNLLALETRALEEKHGVNLSQGQRTGDTALYSQEWNRRGETPTLGNHFNEQPAQVSTAFERAKERHAPDIPPTADASELGQLQINALAAKDKLRTDAIRDAYQKLTDAAGGNFPIDVSALNQNIASELSRNLKTNHLPGSIASDLADFTKNPTFEAYEALRTNLANEMRSNSNGNARAAAYIVRDQLEKLPIFGEGTGSPQAMQLKALADDARALVKERYSVLNSNPAYKAAVNEFGSLKDAASQGESLNAAKFHQKYVANGTPEAIRRMKAEIPEGDIAHQAITFGELNRAKNAAINASERNLTPEQYAKFLRDNASKLRDAVSPGAMQDLVELGALTSKIGMPKTGTFNYSNTYSSMLSDMAKQGAVSATEAKLAALTGGASLPATGLARQFLGKMSKEGFAKKATDPFAGITKE